MQHYKLNLRNRLKAEKLVNCERHVKNISQLPEEHRPQIDLPKFSSTVAAARTCFDELQVLRSQLKAKTAQSNQLINAACRETTYAVGMVTVHAGLKPETMVARGLELERPKRPVGKPDAPTYFQAGPHSDEGAAKLSWKRPLRRCVFEIEMQVEGKNEWKLVQSSVPTKCVITGLKSGGKYWFRVSAVNAHGKGPACNPVAVRVK